ncbi:stalk domain-containing protein [Paenibacillus sp. An7]|uniref:stalk domain-containing protein n=1 Tax=Paenibacillus sp. An7 TaxID=2689577 RepID=UPI001358D13D|nr:stalk domain-containing protein [Paenibacillus sp. An7]
MKFKKLTLLTILALFSQVVPAYTASAEMSMDEPVSSSIIQEESQLEATANKEVKAEGKTDGSSVTEQKEDTISGTKEAATEEAGTETTVITEGTVTGTVEEVTSNPEDQKTPVQTEENPVVPEVPEIPEVQPLSNSSQLILYYNSKKMVQDGVTYYAPQPMQVKSGVSYVPIRALVDRVGFRVSYNNTTKETSIIQGDNELKFKTNSNKYKVNGVSKTMKGTSYQTQNTFMVPLTAITAALGIKYSVVNKSIVMNLSTKPIASFSISPSEVYAGQAVTYKADGFSPKGLSIINERWEGKKDVFDAPGRYTIKYYVQDSSGSWSDPYSLTVNVLRPNQPPVALFVTDKEEYKMGELITYTDQSSDDEAIVKTEWNNNALAFFTPGPKTISLTVKDNKGLTNTYQKTIIITNETLYSLTEFNQLFTPIGEKFSFDGSTVPTWAKVNYSYTDYPSTLLRSNSPETVYKEGIVYRDIAVGNTRFLIHHKNNTGKKVKMYVVATNHNSATAILRTENLGSAGPSTIAQAAGKKAVERYFTTMQDDSKRTATTLKPGESKLILTDMSKTSMKQHEIISLLSDVYCDYPIEYNVVIIDENLDPLKVLYRLPILDRDGVHNRGTYPNATREITYSDRLGEKPERLVIGDNNDDPNLSGIDPMVGVEASNSGNFGVLYKITLERVAPNTLISFNPRGGTYTGYAMVNGEITPLYTDGAVRAPNEQAVLYRTGEYERKVEILLTAAPASSLPVNLLIAPLPSKN